MRQAHARRARGLWVALGVVALGGLLLAPLDPADAVTPPDPVAAAHPSAGSFYPMSTTRLVGGETGATVLPGAPLRVPVLGRPGLPTTGVSAVVLNVTTTATGPRAALLGIRPGFGPLATARPLTSATAPSLGTRTSLVTVPLDPSGAVDVVASAPAAVTLDLVGLYAADDTVVAMLGPSGGYQPSDPVRLLGPGAGAAAPASADDALDPTPSPAPTVDPALAQALEAGGVRRVAVDLGAESAQHVTALLVRVSVVSAPAAGVVTVTASTMADALVAAPTEADPGAEPADPTTAASAALTTPTLSLQRGVTASNLAVVPAVLDDQGLVRLTVTNGLPAATPVRVDLVGFYDDGGLGADLRFRALPVGRVLDTRTGFGTGPLAAFGRGVVSPASDVVGDNTFGLVGSMTTLTAADRPTDVALRRAETHPGEIPPTPLASSAGSVPVAAGDQATTPVQAEVGDSRGVVLAATTGPAQVVLDVVGSFEAYPAVEDASLRDWVHAVPSWQVRALVR
ncbi:MAG: hypothetical protein M3Y71_15745 [Actinomycetota bacterium]|nr:hypothetical protein [Actinomycetota bacterium]